MKTITGADNFEADMAVKSGKERGSKPDGSFADCPYPETCVQWSLWRMGFREGTQEYLRSVEASRKAYEASQ